MDTKNLNICHFLTARSLGHFTNGAGAIYRKNLKILKHLVCQDTTSLRNVWMKQSKSPVVYERGRIYFDNYQCCFSCANSSPKLLYKMPKCSKMEKIEDALLSECPVGELLPSLLDYKSSLITVTANNWLFRVSVNTGEVLEKVFLSSLYRFRYVTWDVPQESLVVKSAQNRQRAMVAQEAGVVQSGVLCLAVFRVLPLSLIGMLEINKNVFGNHVIDATISHGILIVMYRMGLVRLYNFQWITETYTSKKVMLGQKCQWNGTTGIVGDTPFGIPCNITVTDTPPLLFEVPCLENAFQIGGYPWHYIITPNKKKQKGTYHICSLENNTLAENGIQDMKCCSLECDWIYFHPDDSGRVVHVGPNQINVLRLKETPETDHQHQVTEDFVILAKREAKLLHSVTVTASGRVVKKRFEQLDDEPEQETFKIVDYEDELDLLAVVAVTQTESEGRAHIDLYNNQTGTLVKTVPLVEYWDVTYSHRIFFDRETVVHIEQKPNRIFCCYVYKMFRGIAEEEESNP
ncbi:DDB1- and CUL4-associated factor 17 isoform X1 [Latimeria chalumnae]|uniref:DDB1- and CUL4-associated factor 17 isoform X1 n=1 Tax=Latimeria chalumnae TaxID=7897 RepID=UPI00313DB885